MLKNLPCTLLFSPALCPRLPASDQARPEGLSITLWDLFFYLSLARVATSSVRIAGGLLLLSDRAGGLWPLPDQLLCRESVAGLADRYRSEPAG